MLLTSEVNSSTNTLIHSKFSSTAFQCIFINQNGIAMLHGLSRKALFWQRGLAKPSSMILLSTSHVRRQRSQTDNYSTRVPGAVLSTQCAKFEVAPLSFNPLSHTMPSWWPWEKQGWLFWALLSIQRGPSHRPYKSKFSFTFTKKLYASFWEKLVVESQGLDLQSTSCTSVLLLPSYISHY